jgi:hypothetical protein
MKSVFVPQQQWLQRLYVEQQKGSSIMKPSKNTLQLLIILAGLCYSHPAHALEPTIEYTDIPAFGTADPLKGQAGNIAPADYSVAVYIYVSGWWTKPTTTAPLTAISKDGSWECDCIRAESDRHATRFAAFLVPSSYSPPSVSGSPELPEDLYSSAAAYAIQSRPTGRQLDFSGYRWWVKDTFGSTWGPGPNYFSSSTNNVWVDAAGRLHLRVTKVSDKWLCAEVVSMRSFGYGTYRVYVDTPTEVIDLNAILGLFTWSDSPAYAHREIDVEISRWSDETDRNNAQFVVQPWTTPGNLKRFRIPATKSNTTHCFKWTPKNIKFISYENHYKSNKSGNNTCKSWTYSGSDVPKAGDENFRMNLWLSEGIAPSDGEEMEIIISRFEFIPL